MRANCPGCNSNQLFSRQQRIVGETKEIFIRCTMCRWEKVVISYPANEHEIRKDIQKLGTARRKGAPVDRVLRARQAKLREGAIKDAPPGTTVAN